METLMNGTIVLEAALISFLLALWMAWMGLRGLFRLMPAKSQPDAGRVAQPIRLAATRQPSHQRRDAA
jgi:hypothetical protein